MSAAVDDLACPLEVSVMTLVIATRDALRVGGHTDADEVALRAFFKHYREAGWRDLSAGEIARVHRILYGA